MTSNMTRVIPAALTLALCLPACGDGGSAEATSDAMPDAESAEQSLDAAFAEEPIPSQDVADAAAEEEIDESNADEAYDDLKAELDAEGDG